MVSCPNCGEKVEWETDTFGNAGWYCSKCEVFIRNPQTEPSRPIAGRRTIKLKSFEHGKHMKNQLKRIELILFLFLGSIICAVFIPFLIPAVVLYFFYSLLPSEYKLRLEAERQLADTGITGGDTEAFVKAYLNDHRAELSFKGTLKLAVIIAAAFGFSSIHQLLLLITLLIGYFSLPSTYKEDQPEKESLSIIRGVILSITIALYFYFLLKSVVLAIMSFAFFFFLPTVLYEGRIGGRPIHKMDKAIFAVIMIAVFFAIFTPFPGTGWNLGFNFSSPLVILMFTIFIVSFFTGIFATPDSRAYFGVIVLAITMIAYTSAFPGEVGTAVFGAWWPQVEHYSKAITEPLGTAYEEVTAGMGNAWLMMTNPSEWYVKQMELERTKSSAITTGGSVRSIEVNEYRLLSAELDPAQPMAGTIELENRGEFTAKDVKIILNPPTYKKAADRSPIPVKDAVYEMASCTAGLQDKTYKDKDTCKWEQTIYPGTPLFASFKYSSWGEISECSCSSPATDCKTLGGSCSRCIVEKLTITDPNDPTKKIFKEITCGEKGGIVLYTYGGSFATVGFNYSYDYTVNVSLPVDVMNSDLYDKRLINKEITPVKVESQYSGGPVKATIWTQKQPVRAGDDIFGEISILSQGSGKIEDATIRLLIPKLDGFEIKDLTSSLLRCTSKDITSGEWNNYKEVTCRLAKPIEKRDQSARYSFIFKYTKQPADRKSVIFVGFIDYVYKGTRSQEVGIIRAPLQ